MWSSAIARVGADKCDLALETLKKRGGHHLPTLPAFIEATHPDGIMTRDQAAFYHRVRKSTESLDGFLRRAESSAVSEAAKSEIAKCRAILRGERPDLTCNPAVRIGQTVIHPSNFRHHPGEPPQPPKRGVDIIGCWNCGLGTTEETGTKIRGFIYCENCLPYIRGNEEQKPREVKCRYCNKWTAERELVKGMCGECAREWD